MKKLKALSRVVASAALALGTSIAPFALTTGVAHAATPYYWAGTGSSLLSANTTANSSTTKTDISVPTNWSTSSSTYTAGATGFDNGTQLVFDVSSNLTTTGSLSNAPEEVKVVAGQVTIATTASNALAIAPNGKLTVDTPSTSGNALIVNYVNNSGALTLDGIRQSQIPAAGNGGVVGPLTFQVTDTATTANAGFVYDASDLTGLLGTATTSAHKAADFGKNTSLTIADTDFSNAATYWTLTTSHPTTFINLTGSTTGGGTTYLETIVGNGGNIRVTSGSGTATVATINLTANSFANVIGASDVLAATTFNANGFSFTRTSNTDAGTYPTTPTTNNNNGSGQGSNGGTDGGGTTDDANTTDTPAPETPDTGLALVAAHPMTSLIVSAIAAGALFFTARRLKPAARR